jgi:hypothetical protein
MIAAYLSKQRIQTWLVGWLIFAAVAALAVWLHTRTTHELQALQQSERAALYSRTLDTLKGPCSHALDPSLTNYCREQAAFITRFPECDTECHALAARVLQPSR